MNYRIWILGAACALTASAQEPVDGHTYLPPARWSKLEAQDLGQPFYAEGRWLECSGDEVLLLDLTPEQRGFFHVDPNGRLQRRLTQDLTPDGASLARRKSTVRLFGKAQQVSGKRVLHVEDVTAIPGDAERLIAAMSKLGADDPAPYAALVEEAQALAKRYDDDELRALARLVARRQAHVEAQLLGDDDVEGALALSERMLAANDRLGAISLLARLEVKVQDEAQKARLRKRLEGLGATQTGGEWRSYEAFKTDEGFVQTDDKRWVRKEALELKAVIADELAAQQGQLVIVRDNPVDAARAAKSGRLKRGQNAAEARIAAGMPARVAHETRRNQVGEDVVWTQWVTRDGRRAYFMNGEVVRTFAADDAWQLAPKKP
ncbi:MAG: hypothetical protein R3F62_14630 [Planctomycetota bacterium]